VQRIGHAVAHIFQNIKPAVFKSGQSISLSLDTERRRSIEAHHTATHLLHWALHEVVAPDATQQGSSVSPDRLRFDFNSKALTPEQITEMESRVNDCIQQSETVSWKEVPYSQVKGRSDIMQFFGDKYGDRVRVVQIGGEPRGLDGYSMELCGGTHVRETSEIGLFKIKSEGAIAAGVRRIEALCGTAAEAYLRELDAQEAEAKTTALEKLATVNRELEAMGAATFSVAADAPAEDVKAAAVEADKSLKKAQTAGAAKVAKARLVELDLTKDLVISETGPAALLQELFNGLKQEQFARAAFCVVDDGNKLHFGALVGKESEHNAGKLVQTLAPLAGGKGGGKPDMARGAAPQRDQRAQLEAAARKLLRC
jgi:alanyl-tRNA synthetase